MDLQQARELLGQAKEAYKNGEIEKVIDLLRQIKKTSDELRSIYAQAQFTLGLLLAELKRFEEAEQAYKNVNREDSAKDYAKAQFTLGFLLENLKRFEEAEQAYKNVNREDSAENYAKAQNNLGVLFDQLKRFEEAEQAYKNVNYADSAEQYACAQLNLGILLYDLKRFEEAEQAYKNVNYADSAEQYALAQCNLGVLFDQLKRFEEAEQAYKNVNYADSAEQYALAQYNLGVLFDQLKRFDAAEQAYKNVNREDSAEDYAKAQNNLGVLFDQLKRFDAAEQAYKNVNREDSAEDYAKAQNNLGVLFDQLKRFEEAEQAYQNVNHADSAEQYACAQLNLGILLYDLKRFEEAEQAYKNINRNDSTWTYAYAQLGLYFLTKNKKYLENILLEDDLETYAEARFRLGGLEENLDVKNQYWQQIPKDSEQYIKENYQINIVRNIVSLEYSSNKNELFRVFQIVSEILKALFINNKYEQSIAHYTNLKVSKLLLSNKVETEKGKFEAQSKLRLNTINLMNDPEEGLLINKLLGLKSKITTQDSAFIACFTLHHDSLNQFRLYGKENKEEASGLSLVLNNKFFVLEHNTARIYEKNIVLGQEDDKDKAAKNSLAAMPLYRCIYLDPTSGLIKVAQREEWSFQREYKESNKDSILELNPKAEEKWGEYFPAIQEIETDVRSHLEALAKEVKLLNLEDLTKEEKDLLAEILLPLRYLMKHMAFKEEQECRIVYVTQMANDLIQYDEKINRIYIDYEPSVMEHLEKIYLAPKAKGEKMVFEYLCSRGQEVRKGKPPVQVKISQNPFR